MARFGGVQKCESPERNQGSGNQDYTSGADFHLRRSTEPAARPNPSNTYIDGSGTAAFALIVTVPPVGSPGKMESRLESRNSILLKERLATPADIAVNATCARTPLPLTPVVPLKELKMTVIIADPLSIVPPPNVVPRPRNGPSVTPVALSLPAGPNAISNCQPNKSLTPAIVRSIVKF